MKLAIKISTYIIIFLIGSAVGLFMEKSSISREFIVSPLGKGNIKSKERKFDKYSYKSLRKKTFIPSSITFERVIKESKQFTSYLFTFTVDGEKVSGLANIPKGRGSYPVIVMFRGFVDPSLYTTGDGTRRTAEEFSKHGFITLSPDFLGYGESDNPSKNAMEERFQTYTTALTLISSVIRLPKAIASINGPQADIEKIGIWGHSNGGQIALSILEISGENYPSVLWSPVSKPFPYSILYYTDEFEDHGKALRKLVADFEKEYDSEKYSLTNYLDWIKAPIQLHQGTMDQSVPQSWSGNIVSELKKQNVNVSYYTYTGENHNFTSGGWATAVTRSVNFYNQKFRLM